MTIAELEALWPLNTAVVVTMHATHSSGQRMEWQYPGQVVGHYTDPEPGVVVRIANTSGFVRTPLRDVQRRGSSPADNGPSGGTTV